MQSDHFAGEPIHMDDVAAMIGDDDDGAGPSWRSNYNDNVSKYSY